MIDDKDPKLDWDSFPRKKLQRFAQKALSKHGENLVAAAVLKLSPSAIMQMKSTGKGSVISWLKLIAYSLELSKEEIGTLIERLPDLPKSVKSTDELDVLYENLKESYSSNELAAYFKLLISKSVVEQSLNLRIQVDQKDK